MNCNSAPGPICSLVGCLTSEEVHDSTAQLGFLNRTADYESRRGVSQAHAVSDSRSKTLSRALFSMVNLWTIVLSVISSMLPCAIMILVSFA